MNIIILIFLVLQNKNKIIFDEFYSDYEQYQYH